MGQTNDKLSKTNNLLYVVIVMYNSVISYYFTVTLHALTLKVLYEEGAFVIVSAVTSSISIWRGTY